MSSQASILKIEIPQSPLPTCTPHLMPFHIGYSGPAPISTFFRVKPAPPPSYGAFSSKSTIADKTINDSQVTENSQATLVVESTVVASDSMQSTIVSTSSSITLTNDVEMGSTSASTDSEGKHFVAAFRGRAVRGLRVDLPEGFRGIVLRTPEEGSEASKSKPKTAIPPTRRKRNAQPAKYTAEDEDDIDADHLNGTDDLDPDVPIRMLQPTSTFSSFVLWNPDIPVDEGKDEYLRSLTEWTRLAAAIHQYEE